MYSVSLSGPATDGSVADVFAYIPARWVAGVRLDSMRGSGIGPPQMGRLHAGDFRLNERIPYVVVLRGKRGSRRLSRSPS